MDNPLMALLQEEDTGDVTFDLATVYSVDSGGLRLILKNQSDPTQKKYKKLSSYESPQVGDRVVLMKMSGTYVVMGSLDGSSALPAANTVFAGPASGDQAAASFRSLVAADLPIVPISKGGTGQNGLIMTTDPSEILATESGFDCTYAYYAQFGKVAMFVAMLVPDHAGSTSDWTTWATLVPGKRPGAQIVGNCQSTTYVMVGSDGAIQFSWSSYASGGRYRVSATYLLP